MKLSLDDAATVLGKSQRQVRYMIRQGRLPAAKDQGRWRIDSADLPLSERQRQALNERYQAAREAMDKGLAAVPKVTAGDSATDSTGEKAKRAYSVKDLLAFQAGAAIYGELSAKDPARRHLFECLSLVARGCHCYHAADKARRFTEARELASTAVAELLLDQGGDAAGRERLAERIEQELIPKLAGLVASHEKRSRQRRFDRFERAGNR